MRHVKLQKFYISLQDKRKNVLENLAKCLSTPDLTEITARLFPEIVVLLFQELFTVQESDTNKYKQKVIALAKLIDSHSMLKRFVLSVFFLFHFFLIP